VKAGAGSEDQDEHHGAWEEQTGSRHSYEAKKHFAHSQTTAAGLIGSSFFRFLGVAPVRVAPRSHSSSKSSCISPESRVEVERILLDVALRR